MARFCKRPECRDGCPRNVVDCMSDRPMDETVATAHVEHILTWRRHRAERKKSQ